MIGQGLEKVLQTGRQSHVAGQKGWGEFIPDMMAGTKLFTRLR